MTRQPTNPEQAPATRPTRTPRYWPDYPLLRPRSKRGTRRDYRKYPSPQRPGDTGIGDDDRNA